MRANKKQAVALINRAVKAGWSRKVETHVGYDGKPSGVTVFLHSPEQKYAGSWALVYVSFWLSGRYGDPSKRGSVAITSKAWYDKKSKHGLWDASFQIDQFKTV